MPLASSSVNERITQPESFIRRARKGNPNMRQTCYLLGFICLLLGVETAMAQDQSPPVTRLEPVTVVATPVIQGNETDRYGGQKTTVSQDQIADLNAQDLGTALRRSPGVNISRYNMIGSFGGASGGAVFIRGMGSSRPGAEIKMLVDGIPMYMSVWNHPLLDLMSIDAAGAIETYKSPQPHIFGNAFGVVNLVPKKQEREGFVSQVEAAAGSHASYVATAEHGGKQGRWDYYLGGGYRSSDGHREDADGELSDLYARIGYRFSAHWDLSGFTLINDNSATDPGVEGADPAEKEGRYETRSQLFALTLQNRFEQAEGAVKFYRNAGEGDWLDQPTDTPGVREDLFNDFLYYGIKAKERFYLWPGGELIAGLDWEVTDGEYDQRFSNGASDRWAGHDFTILSPYLALSHRFGDSDGFYAIPSAGVRYYDNSDFDAEWSPHAGLILGYKETEFHAGYSRGVIYPGLDVVVLSEKIIPPLGESWKQLEPETADHFELGLRHRFGAVAAFDITWFYDDGKNRYLIVPPPPPPPVYANLESYRIQGVETSLSIHPTDSLSLFAGLTVLDTKPSDLPYAPEITVSGGLNYRFLGAFALSMDCQFTDAIFVDAQARRQGAENTATVESHFLVNGKLSYALEGSVWGLNGAVFVAGENLTDADYEYLPGYPMPGATGMVGLNLKF